MWKEIHCHICYLGKDSIALENFFRIDSFDFVTQKGFDCIGDGEWRPCITVNISLGYLKENASLRTGGFPRFLRARNRFLQKSRKMRSMLMSMGGVWMLTSCQKKDNKNWVGISTSMYNHVKKSLYILVSAFMKILKK